MSHEPWNNLPAVTSPDRVRAKDIRDWKSQYLAAKCLNHPVLIAKLFLVWFWIYFCFMNWRMLPYMAVIYEHYSSIVPLTITESVQNINLEVVYVSLWSMALFYIIETYFPIHVCHRNPRKKDCCLHFTCVSYLYQYLECFHLNVILQQICVPNNLLSCLTAEEMKNSALT